MTNLDNSKLDKLRQDEDLKLRSRLTDTEKLAQQVHDEAMKEIENRLVTTIVENLNTSNKVIRKTLTSLPYQRTTGKTYSFYLDAGHVVRITIEEDINLLIYEGKQLLED